MEKRSPLGDAPTNLTWTEVEALVGLYGKDIHTQTSRGGPLHFPELTLEEAVSRMVVLMVSRDALQQAALEAEVKAGRAPGTWTEGPTE